MKIAKKNNNRGVILAFDGPDNVGKGTQIQLVRKWLKDIPFVLTNLDRPHGDSDVEKLSYGKKASRNHLLAKRCISKNGIHQIADRMHYTEYAYSILRGSHELEDILALEREFIDLRDVFFTIVFIDSVENISKRDDGKSVYRADDYQNISRIRERFIEIAQNSIFPNLIIDINGKSIAQVHEEVKRAIISHVPRLTKKVH